MSKIRVKFSLVNMDEKYEFMCLGLQNLHKIHFHYDEVSYHFNIDDLLFIREDKEKKSTFNFAKKKLVYELKKENISFEASLLVRKLNFQGNKFEVVYQLDETEDLIKIDMNWMEE